MFHTPRKYVLAALAAVMAVLPAYADKQVCDGPINCAALLGEAMVLHAFEPKGGNEALPFNQALQTIVTHQDSWLRKLLKDNPELTRSGTPPFLSSDADTAKLSATDFFLSAGEHNERERQVNQLLGNLNVQQLTTHEHIKHLDEPYVLLWVASSAGNEAAVRMLLEAGVPARTHRSGALLAAQAGNVAKLLIDHGASPKDVDLDLLPGRLDGVFTLEPNPALRDLGFAKMAGILLDAAGETGPQAPHALIILDKAAKRGMPYLVRAMVQRGVDPAGSGKGASPLVSLIASCGQSGAGCYDWIMPGVQALLDKHADVNAVAFEPPNSAFRVNALSLALDGKNDHLIALLRGAGANLDALGRSESTPAEDLAKQAAVCTAAVCPQMAAIPAGSFLPAKIGTPKPALAIAGFEMSRTLVTQGQWRAMMGTNPSQNIRCGDDCPVENVSWNDVQKYLQRLQKYTGQSYRLPTLAEWSYACQAGGTTHFCGSDQLGDVAWLKANSGGASHPVALKQANAWGLYDMLGNVREWTQDCNAATCNYHLVAGADWTTPDNKAIDGNPLYAWTAQSLDTIGFRVVRAPT